MARRGDCSRKLRENLAELDKGVTGVEKTLLELGTEIDETIQAEIDEASTDDRLDAGKVVSKQVHGAFFRRVEDEGFVDFVFKIVCTLFHFSF